MNVNKQDLGESITFKGKTIFVDKSGVLNLSLLGIKDVLEIKELKTIKKNFNWIKTWK